MNIKEIKVNYLLKQITKKDLLFRGDYTLDPYQNCAFGCIYCDSSIDDTIYVKINAADILNKELQSYTPGRIIIGSVHDPYQPVEQKYHLTHQILKKISKTEFSLHILTKSPTVLKDISLIKTLKNPIITFSILGFEESFWKNIELKAPSPMDRLNAMKKIAENGIKTGVAIIPTIPCIDEQNLEETIKMAKKFHASYVIQKPLFLQGMQKEIFLKKINLLYPKYHKKLSKIYKKSNIPSFKQIKKQDNIVKKICYKHNISSKIQLK